MFRYGILFHCILLFHLSCQPTIENGMKHSHFEINAAIDPVSQIVAMEGTLDIICKDTLTSELSFRIHKQFEVENFKVDNIVKYELDTSGATFSSNSKELKFKLQQPVKAGEIIHIEFKYQGKITEWSKWSANTIGSEWVEMGLYFPWFPNGSGSLPSTYKINVDCPSGYQVFSIGEISKSNNTWQIVQDKPINDIMVFISKDMNIAKNVLNELELTLCYHSLSDTIRDAFTDDNGIAYDFFSNWFGLLGNPNLTIIESKREIGGGYARTGTIVLSSFNSMEFFSNRVMYNAFIGHEMAHLWWNRATADSWEDWLNEAFAEYSSLLLIREVFGTEEFEKQLQNRKENIQDLKPIWGISRTDPQAYYVLYHKGAILLHELETKIGKGPFLILLQLCNKNHIKTTNEFLDLLGKQEGETISLWFEEKLKTM